MVRQEVMKRIAYTLSLLFGIILLRHGATRSYTMDCGTTRSSIHSECPYSNVHFWQRICAKLRWQRGVKLNLTVPNR